MGTHTLVQDNKKISIGYGDAGMLHGELVIQFINFS